MIARMHKSAVFANVGRGSTVDEPALVQALLNGDIAGAVLDVTEQEPLPNDHPLWDCPNVILSQHSGGGYADEFKDLIDIFLNNLHKFLAHEPLDNIIDPKKGKTYLCGLMQTIRYLVLFLGITFVFSSCGNFEKLRKKGTDEQKYQAALTYYKKGDYDKAVLLFEELKPILKGSDQQEMATFYEAYCQYADGYGCHAELHQCVSTE
ncbi:Glyoxylate reductase [Corchorus olitorius]|uniref:Glyoxylate reductase n=1 Tax=Corchorus olitorius TaxID=93759 RepID=A0A1R3L0T3_9ROSI|nr:Glyoxylate reductase [Corchorus olitorius]